jgi:hypothetical protein
LRREPCRWAYVSRRNAASCRSTPTLSLMKTDRAALEQACYELARSIRWKDDRVDEVLARGMVEGYVRDALFHEEYLVGRGRDPNFVVDAVRYLAQVHAIPPLEGNMDWFRTALEVLVELACPNAGVTEAQRKFFDELEEGIAESRADYEG